MNQQYKVTKAFKTSAESSAIVHPLSYRADVPDLQGFVIRRRHQEVGVRGPGHIRYTLQLGTVLESSDWDGKDGTNVMF